jgi:hypothetical protein
VIIKGKYHYIFGGEIETSLRHRLTSEIWKVKMWMSLCEK